MKIFIAAMGSGEVSQAVAFAKYALKNSSEIVFSLKREEDKSIMDLEIQNRCKVLFSKDSIELNRSIKKENPDILLLCNSKIFSGDGHYPSNPPKPKPFTVSIDSNWLFGPSSPYKSLPWVDFFLINIPQEVFELGLKENGGHYEIPSETYKKIKVVGLLPSYSKIPLSVIKKTRDEYGILSEEKMIFFYASKASLDPDHIETMVKNLIGAVEVLRDNNRKIKIIMGEDLFRSSKIKDVPWIINMGRKKANEFYTLLSSSDLVFQHQGLGTLEQSISANIPVIANVRDSNSEQSPYHAHAWEVLPFVRFGACSMLYYSASLSSVVNLIDELLYDEGAIQKMKNQQKILVSNGEEAAYNKIKKLNENRN